MVMIDPILEPILQVFFEESIESLSKMEQILLTLEGRPYEREIINTLFRVVHTIKGGAGSFGFEPMVDFAHRVENVLDRMRSEQIILDSVLADLLLRCKDHLRKLVNTVMGENAVSSKLTRNGEELKNQINCYMEGATPSPPVTKIPPTIPLGRPLGESIVPVLEPVAILPIAPAEVSETPEFLDLEVPEASVEALIRVLSEDTPHVQVDATKLGRLIDLVGELVVLGASQKMTAKRLGDSALMESVAALSRLTEEIREVALRLRMVQIGETFSCFQPLIRDLARSLNKEMRLEVNGADTELDESMVELLVDPLTHLVRNSLEHGIELPEERVAVGKPPQGRLDLNAYHDSGSVVIEVADDGRGIDSERILAMAVQVGLMPQDAKPSEAEIFQLIFEPGLSTVSQRTDFSVRGMGMDLVRRVVEGFCGTIEAESLLGVGTVVRLRLPLTLAIIDGFLVGVAGAFYIAPLDTVVECLDLVQAQDHYGTDSINLRGERLPLLWLNQIFATGETGREVRQSVVVVCSAGRKVGLVVDQLLGEFQTVIKPLGEVFRRLSGINGASILGDGEMALILDIPALIQQATVLS
ncbi:two-component system, chemotaxis family, sensor kinase CheA [Gammaproteobacteria bacterium]